MVMKAQLLGVFFLAALACNEPMKSPDQQERDGAGTQPSSDDIAAQAQQYKEQGGLRSSETMLKGNYKFVVRVNGDGTDRSIMVASQDVRGDTTKPADSTIIHDVKGKVTSTVVSDLDNDGNPEVFCFTKSDGTEAVGSVYGMTFIDHKPYRIFSGDAEKSDIDGYEGRDTFFIKQPYLMRKFPAGKELKTIKYSLKREQERFILKETK
jgi:hypothetical protein